jgi:hypothetical protein
MLDVFYFRVAESAHAVMPRKIMKTPLLYLKGE